MQISFISHHDVLNCNILTEIHNQFASDKDFIKKKQEMNQLYI